MRLYVDNLGGGVTDSELRTLFEAYGPVESAQVIVDRATGLSRHCGYVEMKSDQDARAAIAALHGRLVQGQVLTVHELRHKPMSTGRDRRELPRRRPGARRY